MPNYEYFCSWCDHTFEKKKPMNLSDEPERCPQCKRLAKKIPSKVDFRMK